MKWIQMLEQSQTCRSCDQSLCSFNYTFLCLFALGQLGGKWCLFLFALGWVKPCFLGGRRLEWRWLETPRRLVVWSWRETFHALSWDRDPLVSLSPQATPGIESGRPCPQSWWSSRSSSLRWAWWQSKGRQALGLRLPVRRVSASLLDLFLGPIYSDFQDLVEH